MGRFERLGELAPEPEHLVERQSPSTVAVSIPGNPIVERFTVDELHDEHGLGARLFDPEKRGDVGMNERGERERFTPEAGKPLRVGGVAIRKGLERDLAVQASVTGAIDLAHSALAQQFDDFEWAQTPAWLQRHGRVADYMPGGRCPLAGWLRSIVAIRT